MICGKIISICSQIIDSSVQIVLFSKNALYNKYCICVELIKYISNKWLLLSPLPFAFGD